jgi:L-fucose mutarotase/ribose pyranase (RbsD/FucU family)
MSEHCCQHDEEEEDWEQQLEELLPLLGHRNWIVVADAAYPAQSNPGIDTAVVDCSQIEAVTRVFAAIGAQKHIRANVYVDTELAFVDEADAKGIASYRTQLESLLGSSASKLPHEEIIAKLDRSAEVFRILILKTNLTIPYTSVFFELDCGYWSAEAEQRLRALMAEAGKSK